MRFQLFWLAETVSVIADPSTLGAEVGGAHHQLLVRVQGPLQRIGLNQLAEGLVFQLFHGQDEAGPPASCAEPKDWSAR
jgi:hypothetical protein